MNNQDYDSHPTELRMSPRDRLQILLATLTNIRQSLDKLDPKEGTPEWRRRGLARQLEAAANDVLIYLDHPDKKHIYTIEEITDLEKRTNDFITNG